MSKLIVNEIEKYDAAQLTVTGNLNVTGSISGTLTANLSDLVDVSSASPSDGQVLTYDTVNGWQPEDSQGGEEYTISEISTNTTAQVNFLYVLTANLTLTLPATPSVGDRVALSNMSGTTTPTVARNGNLIAGLAEDLTIDVLNLSVEFIYSGASQGWIIFVDSILGTSGGGGSVDGNGTTNYISKWSDANTLTDSLIQDDGTTVSVGGNLAVDTNTLFVDAANNRVGVGTSSPTAKLQVEDTTATAATSIVNIVGQNGYVYQVRSLTNSLAVLGNLFDHNIISGSGQFSWSVNGSEKARITTNGLTFNGDTAAANALDDYEEGTFTPTVVGSATAGTATYSTRQGSYVKIGNLVTISILVVYTSGTGTGNLTITGLPFTIGSYYSNLCVGNLANITLPSNSTPAAIALINSTSILMEGISLVGGGQVGIGYDGAGTILITGTYFV